MSASEMKMSDDGAAEKNTLTGQRRIQYSIV